MQNCRVSFIYLFYIGTYYCSNSSIWAKFSITINVSDDLLNAIALNNKRYCRLSVFFILINATYASIFTQKHLSFKMFNFLTSDKYFISPKKKKWRCTAEKDAVQYFQICSLSTERIDRCADQRRLLCLFYSIFAKTVCQTLCVNRSDALQHSIYAFGKLEQKESNFTEMLQIKKLLL